MSLVFPARSVPLIDDLIVVCYDEEVWVIRGYEEPKEIVLCTICVLEFIHTNEAPCYRVKRATPAFSDSNFFAKWRRPRSPVGCFPVQ